MTHINQLKEMSGQIRSILGENLLATAQAMSLLKSLNQSIEELQTVPSPEELAGTQELTDKRLVGRPRGIFKKVGHKNQFEKKYPLSLKKKVLEGTKTHTFNELIKKYGMSDGAISLWKNKYGRYGEKIVL